MELLPTSSPVYGGGVIMTFLPEDYILPSSIRAFLVFTGSKEQQITEAGISYELNAFQAIIPDHEPPENVDISVYILFGSGECKCIATERFNFFLDQTCFLARYLADSIHNVESLEDWDCIRGENFSLQKENFTTLDNRLTPAFKHLILPHSWNMLGSPDIRHVQRETLFHFAGRLGLVEFANLLLHKPGAEECLMVKNRSNELAASVARVHGNGQLAYLFSNPHKHRKEKEDEEEDERGGREEKWIYPDSTIKHAAYNTTSSVTLRYPPHHHLHHLPNTEELIGMFSTRSKPPLVSISYDVAAAAGAASNVTATASDAMAPSASDAPQHHQHARQSISYQEAGDSDEVVVLEEFCRQQNIGLYAANNSGGGATSSGYHHHHSYVDPSIDVVDVHLNQRHPPAASAGDYDKMGGYEDDEDDDAIDDSKPYQVVNVEQDDASARKRLSISCPDLAPNLHHQTGTVVDGDEDNDDDIVQQQQMMVQIPRTRAALPALHISEHQLEAEINAAGGLNDDEDDENDDIRMKRSSSGDLGHQRGSCMATSSSDVTHQHTSSPPSTSSPTRRHSWHSSENLNTNNTAEQQQHNRIYHDGQPQHASIDDSAGSMVAMHNTAQQEDHASNLQQQQQRPQRRHGVVRRGELLEGDEFSTFAILKSSNPHQPTPTTRFHFPPSSSSRHHDDDVVGDDDGRDVNAPAGESLQQSQARREAGGIRQRGMSYPVEGPDSTIHLSAATEQAERRYTICGEDGEQASASSAHGDEGDDVGEAVSLRRNQQANDDNNQQQQGERQAEKQELMRGGVGEAPPPLPKPQLPPKPSKLVVLDDFKPPPLPHNHHVTAQQTTSSNQAEEKKIVTRKISFLKQLRSSKMKKNSKNKPKLSPLLQEDDSDRGGGDSDNRSSGGSSIKSKHQQQQRATASNLFGGGGVGSNGGGNDLRPHSMMLHRHNYPVGNPAGQRGQPRPTSTYTSGRFGSVQTSNNHQLNQQDSQLSSLFTLRKDLEALEQQSVDEWEGEDIESNELVMKSNDAEAWSVGVDKKTTRKMSKKDIKRQEIIYELIQTERNYLEVLLIMQRIFARCMSRDAQWSEGQIARFFPRIDQHVAFVSRFLRRLLNRQQQNKVVRRVGDLLVEHWSGKSGEEMVELFGAFCSNNIEMNLIYKELVKSDKKFAALVKRAKENPRTKRKGIPECYLLVTQRVTKYPIMVHSLLDNTNKKENCEEYEEVERALELSRGIAKSVDEQVRDRERHLRLLDIHDKTDPRSTTHLVSGGKFERKDLISKNRKLSFCSETVQLVKDQKKLLDVFLVVLNDCIVIMQESNGKYQFIPSPSSAVVKLRKLILREVAYNNDGLFLINAQTNQMVELRISSHDKLKKMITLIRTAVGHAPEHDLDEEQEEGSGSGSGGAGSDGQGERRRAHQAEQERRWRELFVAMRGKDEEMAALMEERMNFLVKMQQLHSSSTDDAATEDNLAATDSTSQDGVRGASKLVRYNTDDNNDTSPFPPSLPHLTALAQFAKQLLQTLIDQQSSSSPNRDEHDGAMTSSETHLATSTSSSSVTSEAASSPNIAWGGGGESGEATTPTTSSGLSSRIGVTNQQLVSSLTHLTQLCDRYVSHALQQDSNIVKLHWKMEQEKCRSKQHRSGNLLEEAELKRNQVKQEEQLDQLRKEQQKLKSQQENFERYKERQMRGMEQRQHQLEEQQRDQQTSQEKIERDRDEIQQMKEELQRELARVRNLSKNNDAPLPGAVPTAASTNNSATSNMNNNNKLQRGASPTGSELSSWSSTASAASSSLARSSTSSLLANSSNKPQMRLDPNTLGSTDSLPIHLQYSALNQMAAGGAARVQQQFFTKSLSKLAKNGGEGKHSSGSGKQHGGGGGGKKQGSNSSNNASSNPPQAIHHHHHHHHQKQTSEPVLLPPHHPQPSVRHKPSSASSGSGRSVSPYLLHNAPSSGEELTSLSTSSKRRQSSASSGSSSRGGADKQPRHQAKADAVELFL